MKLKRLIIFIFIIILLGLLSFYYPKITGEAVKEYERETIFVSRVIDGDTFEDRVGQSYRLLGINTPEKKTSYYQEAKDFLKQFENKSIEVLRDSEDIDRYDRKLRYVFYNKRLLNVEILERGLGTSFMINGLKYEDKLKNAEKFAKENGINLWVKSKDKCAYCIELVELNFSDEFFIIRNNCSFNCELNEWVVKDDANHFFKLNKLEPGEDEKYISKTKIWNDEGDRFFMRDNNGRLVVFYGYGNEV